MRELPRAARPARRRGRYALLKLATGAMRVGISARLAKTAFAQAFGVAVEDVEEYWHGQSPPYAELFAWAADGAPPPDGRGHAAVPPVHARPPARRHGGRPRRLCRRVEMGRHPHPAASTPAARRGSIRARATISPAPSPRWPTALTIPAVLDGELLVRGSHQGGEAGGAASFNALQQRLGRKDVSKKMLAEYPGLRAALRRADPRRRGLARAAVERAPRAARGADAAAAAERFDLSRWSSADHFEQLAAIRAGARDEAIEGLMLKRRDRPMSPGAAPGCGTNGSATRCWSTAC